MGLEFGHFQLALHRELNLRSASPGGGPEDFTFLRIRYRREACPQPTRPEPVSAVIPRALNPKPG